MQPALPGLLALQRQAGNAAVQRFLWGGDARRVAAGYLSRAVDGEVRSVLGDLRELPARHRDDVAAEFLRMARDPSHAEQARAQHHGSADILDRLSTLSGGGELLRGLADELESGVADADERALAAVARDAELRGERRNAERAVQEERAADRRSRVWEQGVPRTPMPDMGANERALHRAFLAWVARVEPATVVADRPTQDQARTVEHAIRNLVVAPTWPEHAELNAADRDRVAAALPALVERLEALRARRLAELAAVAEQARTGLREVRPSISNELEALRAAGPFTSLVLLVATIRGADVHELAAIAGQAAPVDGLLGAAVMARGAARIRAATRAPSTAGVVATGPRAPIVMNPGVEYRQGAPVRWDLSPRPNSLGLTLHHGRQPIGAGVIADTNIARILDALARGEPVEPSWANAITRLAQLGVTGAAITQYVRSELEARRSDSTGARGAPAMTRLLARANLPRAEYRALQDELTAAGVDLKDVPVVIEAATAPGAGGMPLVTYDAPLIGALFTLAEPMLPSAREEHSARAQQTGGARAPRPVPTRDSLGRRPQPGTRRDEYANIAEYLHHVHNADRFTIRIGAYRLAVVPIQPVGERPGPQISNRLRDQIRREPPITLRPPR
ncbi:MULTISPECIES: hypothetical protein [unclassified Saccharothrix]|uniref:hypothetical protein n=1 Tax=unclassified Saccharothrix TaxID=2593673 RepID=UPI00307EEF8D